MSVGQKISIKLKSYDHRDLDISADKIISRAKDTGSVVNGAIPLPTSIYKFTVLRSPHVYKTARDQFEVRTHKRLIEISNMTEKTVDSLMDIKLEPGVEAEIKTISGK